MVQFTSCYYQRIYELFIEMQGYGNFSFREVLACVLILRDVNFLTTMQEAEKSEYKSNDYLHLL
jgi:hypothetical protein